MHTHAQWHARVRVLATACMRTVDCVVQCSGPGTGSLYEYTCVAACAIKILYVSM